MGTSNERLPWYTDPFKLIIGAGTVGAGLLWWFSAGQPGIPPKDGDYSCLNASSFADHQRAKEQYGFYTFNPLEDQYGVTLEDGSITGARIYLAEAEISDPAHRANNFAFGAKETPTSFTATIDGVQVGCWIE